MSYQFIVGCKVYVKSGYTEWYRRTQTTAAVHIICDGYLVRVLEGPDDAGDVHVRYETPLLDVEAFIPREYLVGKTADTEARQ